MAPLNADRNTQRALGDRRRGGVAAATTIFAGALIMRNAAGYITQGAAATGLIGIGRAEQHVANPGDAGAVEIEYTPGIFRWLNSGGGDAITIADIGAPCYAVDDQTVAKTDDSGARSIAGFVDHVDSLGVWVRCDEALARAYVQLSGS